VKRGKKRIGGLEDCKNKFGGQFKKKVKGELKETGYRLSPV
jgi:hypothetical protein